MSNRVNLSDAEIFMSKVAELAENTLTAASADYVGILADESQGPFPDVATSESTMIGNGTERPQRLRRGWIIPNEITFTGQLNCETSARMGGRLLGGTRTASAELAVGAGAYDITTLQQRKNQGTFPKLSGVGFDYGAYKFVFPGMAMQNFETSFDGTNDVKFSATLRNTGYWRYNALQAALEAMGFPAAMAAVLAINPVIVPPVAPVHHLMHPAAVKVTFAGDTGTVDFAQDGDLVSGACGMSQEIIVDQVPGDLFLVAADRKRGAYARKVHRGKRTPMARLETFMPDDLKAFVLASKGAIVTALTYLYRSDEPIGASNYFYEFEWKCPVAEIQNVTPSPKGSNAGTAINFYPNSEAVTGAYWEQRVRTGDNTIQ